MPKIVKDPTQKRVSCNISLPLGYVSEMDSFVERLLAVYGDQLPKTFCRSDLVRILVDRYFVRPVMDRKGKRFSLSKNDDDFLQVAFDVGQEYGLQDPDQIEMDFDSMQEDDDGVEKKNA